MKEIEEKVRRRKREREEEKDTYLFKSLFNRYALTSRMKILILLSSFKVRGRRYQNLAQSLMETFEPAVELKVVRWKSNLVRVLYECKVQFVKLE